MGDINPWICSLCGRMSRPQHIGALHGIALYEAQSTLEFKPREFPYEDDWVPPMGVGADYIKRHQETAS